VAERSLVPVASSLGLVDASSIVEATLAAGRAHSLLPLTVAVVDAGGHLVAMKREDGCGTARIDIALGKARAAVGMGMSGRTLRDRLAQRIAFQAAVAAATGGNFVPVPGGVLVLGPDGQAVGAIGVSGDASDRDEYAAVAGAQAVGFATDPAEPSPDWSEASL
jgi:glc operon protein GlcG